MGYCVKCIRSVFHLPTGSADAARQNIERMDGVKHDSLAEALAYWGWGISKDDAGDVIGISWWADKLGDQPEALRAISPFVTEGSYVEMAGEDGQLWRYVFKGGRLKEIRPQIIWEGS